MGSIPVVGIKDGGSSTSESSSSVPHLPPIRTVLSPIKDVSRETTSHNLSLPPIGNSEFFVLSSCELRSGVQVNNVFVVIFSFHIIITKSSLTHRAYV